MSSLAAVPAGVLPIPGFAATGRQARSAPVPAHAVDEAELVARSRDRDEEAFRVLVQHHQDRAVGLAMRITRSRPDAEDVAQEAFVRAWLALPNFRGDAAFGTWLHRIVARRALDRAETLRTRRGRETDLDAAAQSGSSSHDSHRDVLLEARLERLLARLGPTQRAVVALFYLRDQSIEDVGEALDMPANTVKTHLSRARAALREAWELEGGEPA